MDARVRAPDNRSRLDTGLGSDAGNVIQFFVLEFIRSGFIRHSKFDCALPLVLQRTGIYGVRILHTCAPVESERSVRTMLHGIVTQTECNLG